MAADWPSVDTPYIMYLRFISPVRPTARSVDYGLFQAIIACRDYDDYPKWLRSQVEAEFVWFKTYLPSPDETNFPDHNVRARAAHICWFRAEAKEMVKRAFSIKALLNEIGCTIIVRKTNNPGQIIYSDNWQVVARPDKRTSIRWA